MKDNSVLQACEPVSASLPSQANLPQRILVVEDDSCIREFDANVLSRCGYAVDAAADGSAGWTALQDSDYDLLITDNNMPGLTGIELLKKLRNARRELLTIMATGTLPTEEFTRYPWLQPAAILLKPYTVAELLATVTKVLRDASPPVARVVELTSQEPERNAPAAVLRPGGPHSAHRILVVDEDRDLRQMYTETLAGPGHQVDGVADGAVAWAALQANQYQLLITENELPGLTGMELVRSARAARMDLPIVMIAARLPSPELMDDLARSRAVILMKPFVADTLLETVKNVLLTPGGPRKPVASQRNWQSQPAAVGLESG